MDAENIAENARKSISSFCEKECRSYCCRKGYLVLTGWEAELLTQNMVKEYEAKGNLKKISEDKYSLFLGAKDQPCPCLEGLRCRIHTHPERPLACRQFPVFIDEKTKTVKLSRRCLAVKQDRFYPYVKQWMTLGYKVIEGFPLSDSDFFMNASNFRKNG